MFNGNTIVDAKGDLITATGSDVPARLAVGNNGDTLLADSSTSTGLRYNPQNALANPVINGGFDIWQRGTSALNGGNTYVTADRWLCAQATVTTFSRQLTGDTTNLPNIQYCLRAQRTSGSSQTDAMNISQSMETVNSIPFAGKTITLSFYARRGANYSVASNALNVQLITGTGTDQNVYTVGYTGSVTAINQNATLTTTWQRFAYTATLASNITEMGITFVATTTGTAGAADYYEITGVQIDLGTYTASSAPTFRRSGGTLQGELAACQRYYYRVAPTDAVEVFANGVAISTTQALFSVPFPVKLRVLPTALEQSGTASQYRTMRANASQDDLTAVPAYDAASSSSVGFILTTSSNLVAGNATVLFSNSTSAYLGWSAEL